MLLKDIFLIEGRDAPLYHGTSLGNALKIIKGNEIWGGTQHDLNRDDEPVFGVSLTRSKHLAQGFAGNNGVVFELDQAKLVQNHKLVPIDYWAFHNPKKKSLRGLGPHVGGDRYEYEEFCVGSIEPLNRFLKAIHMTGKGYRRAETEYAWNAVQELLDNPMLRVDGRPVKTLTNQ